MGEFSITINSESTSSFTHNSREVDISFFRKRKETRRRRRLRLGPDLVELEPSTVSISRSLSIVIWENVLSFGETVSLHMVLVKRPVYSGFGFGGTRLPI